ncbi:MAG: CgeB family protein [Candidatus Binatia bacterium]
MRILYTGPLTPDDTCELRRRVLERLGHPTIAVDYLGFVGRYGTTLRRAQWRLRTGPMVRDYNRALVQALGARPDVLWVDKGIFVTPATLGAARRAGVRWLVHYSPDNYLMRQNASRHLWSGLPLYDLVVTTKRHNQMLLGAAGARRAVFSGNAYDPEVHRPMTLTMPERVTLATDVSFVGRWEPSRERLLARLAALPIRVRVCGPGWERVRSRALRSICVPGAVFGDAYAKTIAAAKINLGLLSTLAGDTITQRSIEIPACGAFMLAERTSEHEAHFADGEEAVFFDGVDDLVRKVQRYLAAEAERRRIAAAGRARCLRSGYSYEARLGAILEGLEGARPAREAAA